MYRTLKIVLFIIIAGLALSSCKNENASKNDATTATGKAINGNWYKRFTGTIAGQPVIVNMVCTTDMSGEPVINGTYYYVNKSELFDIDVDVDSTVKNMLHVTESLSTGRQSEDAPQPSHTWEITLDGAQATGKFHNATSQKTYDISLQEDYTDAYSFAVVRFNDSTTFQGQGWDAVGQCSYKGIEPARNANQADERFIAETLLRELGNDSGRIKTLSEFPRKHVASYLENYKADMQEIGADGKEEEAMMNYEQSIAAFPVYNANGLLVIGVSYYEYSGGAHGNYGSNYLDLDVRNKKVLKLGDILNVDSAAISAMLDAAARVKFNIAPDVLLEDAILTASVPATDNFIVTDRGLIFCYSPYEVASYADGEVKLFLPYAKLKALLKPDFVLRMGLKI